MQNKKYVFKIDLFKYLAKKYNRISLESLSLSQKILLQKKLLANRHMQPSIDTNYNYSKDP